MKKFGLLFLCLASMAAGGKVSKLPSETKFMVIANIGSFMRYVENDTRYYGVQQKRDIRIEEWRLNPEVEAWATKRLRKSRFDVVSFREVTATSAVTDAASLETSAVDIADQSDLLIEGFGVYGAAQKVGADYVIWLEDLKPKAVSKTKAQELGGYGFVRPVGATIVNLLVDTSAFAAIEVRIIAVDSQALFAERDVGRSVPAPEVALPKNPMVAARAEDFLPHREKVVEAIKFAIVGAFDKLDLDAAK